MTERPKRKAIPDKIKLQVVLRQDGRCPQCKERLGALSGLQFDHRPALINRDINDDGTDYLPPQLDPESIQSVHSDCHAIRTFGRGGERRISTAGSDIGIRDKTERLRKAAEMRRKLLAPTAPDDPPPESTKRNKPKTNWPKRPFPKRPSMKENRQ